MLAESKNKQSLCSSPASMSELGALDKCSTDAIEAQLANHENEAQLLRAELQRRGQKSSGLLSARSNISSLRDESTITSHGSFGGEELQRQWDHVHEKCERLGKCLQWEMSESSRLEAEMMKLQSALGMEARSRASTGGLRRLELPRQRCKRKSVNSPETLPEASSAACHQAQATGRSASPCAPRRRSSSPTAPLSRRRDGTAAPAAPHAPVACVREAVVNAQAPSAPDAEASRQRRRSRPGSASPPSRPTGSAARQQSRPESASPRGRWAGGATSRSDEIDELWCRALQSFSANPDWVLVKERPGVYRLGSPAGKAIVSKVTHGGLQVRVGGGWMKSGDFLERYGPAVFGGGQPSTEEHPPSVERLVTPTKCWASKIGVRTAPDYREQREASLRPTSFWSPPEVVLTADMCDEPVAASKIAEDNAKEMRAWSRPC